MLFTERFTKDLFWSFIFILFIYGITHNPITHPTPKPVQGKWNIQLKQHPLMFGITGHNYLTLRNQDNNIVGELHGLATDTKTNNWKYVGSKSSDKLQVWEFNGPRNYIAEKNFPGIILSEGDTNEIINLWDKALVCKDEINKLNISYPPFGVNMRGETENSNSVAHTLINCMGLDAKHVGIFTPGDGKDLLDSKR